MIEKIDDKITREKKDQLIGTTSWLVPGTYYENARLVAQIVDFVELLIYTWDEDTEKILKLEIDKLKMLTEKYDLKYTVHLPTDSIENVEKALVFFDEKLNIINYVIHSFKEDKFAKLLEKYDKLSVENLKEDIQYHKRFVYDVGHSILGAKVDLYKLLNSGEVTEIHLMGIKNGKDHLQVSFEDLNMVYEELGDLLLSTKLICFEVFSLKELINSITVWERWFNKLTNRR